MTLSTPVQAARTAPSTLGSVSLAPEVEKTLKRLSTRAQEAAQKRDALIVEARRAGASLRELEQVTGINHVTIMRMIQRFETDHIQPQKPGDDPDNLVILTPEENRGER